MTYKEAKVIKIKLYRYIFKIREQKKIENYSKILKSWTPPHNMHTFSFSNYEFIVALLVKNLI